MEKTQEAKHFLNRELSWLEFNQRVLDEACDSANPLLERLKFFTIVSSNLDEFFEVRVAGLKQQIESGNHARTVDGLTPTEVFEAITARVRKMIADKYACWHEELQPALARHRLRIHDVCSLKQDDQAWVEEFYHRKVRPVLTPLAIDPAHPFPQLLNKSLNLMVRLEMSKDGATLKQLAVVQCPSILPRLIQLPRGDDRRDYVFLGQLIGHFLADLFPGTSLLGYWPFRLTRNSELYVDEGDTPNLLKAVEEELHKRRRGQAVRLEIAHDCPIPIREALLKTLHLTEQDLYLVNGPLNPTRLMALYQGNHSPELRDPPFLAPVGAALRGKKDIFAAIRERDILLHHPYENYSSVVEFLETAATDRDTLAIKMTLYRTGGDPRIIGALMNAVNNGKQVTAVVELRARFDEANNIEWARKLEENGVHVVYGLVGYKIHAKVALVVRREGEKIIRYVHLATGNYNPTTARLYTDLSLLTCRAEFGEDATNLFNLLTGICQFLGMNKLMVAPFDLHDRLLKLMARETEHARRGLPARIIAKCNSLVEPRLIEALYTASQAGVKIDLVIRGICCLRPGVAGLSENITVRSIVDRFLEHSRIYYFENACQPEIFVGSADWMPRNLFRRIEVVFPIEDGVLCDRLYREILGVTLADNTKARFLGPDGSYRRAQPASDDAPHRSQMEFIALAQPKTGEKAMEGYPRVELAASPFANSEKRAKRLGH
ncbi:MAG TPA: polyphosphate kinase 1 [Candidatus Acidoferrales bacterium]|nr:polyphosphate kinase 1 [Candidatus Acidoferrales bacterium]